MVSEQIEADSNSRWRKFQGQVIPTPVSFPGELPLPLPSPLPLALPLLPPLLSFSAYASTSVTSPSRPMRYGKEARNKVKGRTYKNRRLVQVENIYKSLSFMWGLMGKRVHRVV